MIREEKERISNNINRMEKGAFPFMLDHSSKCHAFSYSLCARLVRSVEHLLKMFSLMLSVARDVETSPVLFYICITCLEHNSIKFKYEVVG